MSSFNDTDSFGKRHAMGIAGFIVPEVALISIGQLGIDNAGYSHNAPAV
jgi:hypothetical protein